MCVLPADAGVRRHEPRVDRERVAADPRSASVPLVLHGVSGGRPHAGPPHQEGPEGAAQDGGQLPQVTHQNQNTFISPTEGKGTFVTAEKSQRQIHVN